MTNSQHKLITFLSVAQRRMRYLKLYDLLAFYVFCGMLLSGIILLVNRFIYLSDGVYYFAAIPVFIGLVIALSRTFLEKLTLYDVAYKLDVELDLKERLCTALELVDAGRVEEFALLQIDDTVHIAQDVSLKDVYPYTLPRFAKFIPIALSLILVSWMIPRYYQLPSELTAAERAAMQEAADALEENLNSQNALTEAIAKELKGNIATLRNGKTDVRSIQKQLAELRGEINAQREDSEQTLKAMDTAMQQSPLFPDKAPDAIAKELEKYAEQLQNDEIPPEVKKELEEILKRLLAQLDGFKASQTLVDQLRAIESQKLSPEALRSIAQKLSELENSKQSMEQLEQMLAQIQDSQQKIGLAGLDLERKDGGVARSDSGAGSESNTGEAQGTEVNVDAAPTGNESTELTLKAQETAEESFSSASTRETPETRSEVSASYQEAYLNARQAMSEAVTSGRIPPRYRKYVSEYFNAIAPSH